MSLLDFVNKTLRGDWLFASSFGIYAIVALGHGDGRNGNCFLATWVADWVGRGHIGTRTPFDEDGWRVPPRHAGTTRDPKMKTANWTGDGGDPAERHAARVTVRHPSLTGRRGRHVLRGWCIALRSSERSLHHIAPMLGISTDSEPDDSSVKSFRIAPTALRWCMSRPVPSRSGRPTPIETPHAPSALRIEPASGPASRSRKPR